jgi:tetratricopeptide (TPR) repeat protein
VSRWHRVWLVIAWLLCASAAFAAADDSQDLNRQFQSAVAQYDAGNYAGAAAQLERILPHAQNSFEVRELLGMVYASLGQDTKAIEQLGAAVRLKPDSGAARVNLASTLVHAGQNTEAVTQFRKAVELEPGNYTANHDLGELYVQAGKLADALPLLARAQTIDPASYDNGYDLAQADFLTGKLNDARSVIQLLLAKKNTGELHNLLAQVDEKDGKFVDAAKEYEAAAQMDPSEDHLFDWASELLLHRTYEPAIEVFRAATQRYPKSPRLEIGLGMALYARGLYEDAVKALLTAADLAPADARCYLFLSKAYESSPTQADEVIEHFRRFSELQPANASAQYYYAMSLWKGKRAEDTNVDLTAVESQLKKAIAINDSLADAHMQLGVLYADRHEYEKSIPELERAIQLDQNLPDAHYRLATDYVHAGQKEKAQAEFAIYQKQRAEHMAELDKERAEVQQFVYSAKGEQAAKP